MSNVTGKTNLIIGVSRALISRWLASSPIYARAALLDTLLADLIDYPFWTQEQEGESIERREDDGNCDPKFPYATDWPVNPRFGSSKTGVRCRLRCFYSASQLPSF